MYTENAYRFSAIGVFLIGAVISSWFRRKADRETGERISPRSEGLPVMIALRVVGFLLWAGVFAYLINPAWMTWSQVQLPGWLRWLGLALGIAADLLSFWVFSNLGNNVSPSVATRNTQQLVTSGPYRWVRHPLYSMGMLAYLSFALLASNWFIALLSIAVFLVLLIRLPQEETHLLARFGDEYRAYMQRTGRFLPRFSALEAAAMNEIMFRILAAVILFSAIGVSVYHRRKADLEAGGRVSTRDEGTLMVLALRLGGLLLWLSAIAYIINPAWLGWSKAGLPLPFRWLGVGMGLVSISSFSGSFAAWGTPSVPRFPRARIIVSSPAALIVISAIPCIPLGPSYFFPSRWPPIIGSLHCWRSLPLFSSPSAPPTKKPI